MNKVVAACCTPDHLTTIQHFSDRDDRELVAVALDLGHGPCLRELHDAARAAGASRCHAFDVREEFARECVLPAIAAETASDAAAELQARTRDFVLKKLTAVALLEGDADVIATSVAAPPTVTRPAPAAPGGSAQVTIAFDAGVPASINGVTMSLSQILDSLGTIAAAHGVAGEGKALLALHTAYRALAAGQRSPSGSTRLLFSTGSVSVLQPEYTTT